jgi:CO dehydrogenase/acetyl-CoA synthase alpha subunit
VPFPLYFDDDCADADVIRELRRRGCDVVRATDVGMRGKPDADHLKMAAGQGRALVTSNQGDFMELHAQAMRVGASHAGIVIITQRRWSAGEQTRRLVALQGQRTAPDMIDQVEFLSHWGSTEA